MNLSLKYFVSGLFFTTLVSFNSNAQLNQTNNDQLNLIDLGRRIENYISFYTSKFSYEAIKATTGQKISVKATALIINGDTLDPEEISTRGHTTLAYRRKSFSFKLNSDASFHHGERTEAFKKFLILSLSMDRNYCNNRLAFEMMETCQLFDLFYSFCELRINGNSEGICMVIERPEDWAIKKKDSPVIIRRGYDGSINKIMTGKKTERDEIRKYSNYFREIYRSLNIYEGEELYKRLSGWLDMDVYMKWIAFNFFVRNGDYTDEIYFYVDPGINKFSIIPWDYDDLFFLAPHEGNIESKKNIGDKFIFSTEDLLDKKIATDPYLYKIYLVQLREVLNHMSKAVLKEIFENTYADLYPYYSNNEIISNSKYDAYKDTNLEQLKSHMLSLYEHLSISREIYLNYPVSKN
ncbi:MAG: CotH kinase family protein [Bacteroidales bacterium]|nr:CotH kinase family protein [Bacteroidales bacterium]